MEQSFDGVASRKNHTGWRTGEQCGIEWSDFDDNALNGVTNLISSPHRLDAWTVFGNMIVFLWAQGHGPGMRLLQEETSQGSILFRGPRRDCRNGSGQEKSHPRKYRTGAVSACAVDQSSRSRATQTKFKLSGKGS